MGQMVLIFISIVGVIWVYNIMKISNMDTTKNEKKKQRELNNLILIFSTFLVGLFVFILKKMGV